MNKEKKILVLGGAGYIGSQMNKILNKRGYSTVVFDNLIRGHRDLVKWGDFVQGDLGSLEQIRRVFSEHAIGAVMHFAAFAYVGESVKSPQLYYFNNVANSLNLFQVMLEYNVKYCVFSSSCSTYGNPVKLPISEDHIQIPINPYARSKMMIENILSDYNHAYSLKYVALRYFNAAGADFDSEIGEHHDPETHIIPIVLDVAIGKRKHVEVFGVDYPTPDGTCIRDYIHVQDLAEAHILALEYLLAGGESDVFNLGNGQGFSVREVIETTNIITKKDNPFVEVERRPGDPAVLISLSEKARNILKWKPEYADLSVIIQSAWNWHQKRFKNGR